MRISRDGMDILGGYAWPGNVRELQNVIFGADFGSVVHHFRDWSPSMLHPGEVRRLAEALPAIGVATAGRSLKAIVEAVERRSAEDALREHGSTRKAASARRRPVDDRQEGEAAGVCSARALPRYSFR